MENNNKKITIADLARMVQGGFSDMKEDMDELKGGMNGRMEKLEKSNQQILKRLEGVDKERIDGIETRVKNVEDLFAIPAKK